MKKAIKHIRSKNPVLNGTTVIIDNSLKKFLNTDLYFTDKFNSAKKHLEEIGLPPYKLLIDMAIKDKKKRN